MGIAKNRARCFAAALSSGALVLTAAASLAPAATLDDQTCEQLKREIVQLEGLGARDNLAKGAPWGKANLRGPQLEQVKKLIEMDEVVAFRCPKPKPKPDPAVVAKAKAQGQAKVQSAEGGVAQDIVKPKPKPRPKPAPVAEGGQGEVAPAAVASRPKPRPAQQPKAPDAYAPPKTAPAQ